MTAELLGSTDSTERTLERGEFAALYAQAQHFYAHQMQILDAHDGERWAQAFTEDAVFELPHLPGPAGPRTGLAHYARAAADRSRRAGDGLRHFVGMLDVRPQPDGTLHTRCSALVHAAPPGTASKALYVCVMEDVLVHTHGTWRTAHRRIIRDDLA